MGALPRSATNEHEGHADDGFTTKVHEDTRSHAAPHEPPRGFESLSGILIRQQKCDDMAGLLTRFVAAPFFGSLLLHMGGLQGVADGQMLRSD